MQIRELLSDDDAVSPVIGVILMVAITVILAAVIASFVLGLGDNVESQPQASFSFDYDQSDTNVTIIHDGGDSIEAQELYVRGSGINDDPAHINASSNNQTWSNDYSDYDATAEISAGQSIVTSVDDDYELRVIYQPIEGDTSATLAEDSGPNA